MEKLHKNTDNPVSKISEYQRFIKLNLQFIHALEAEGADTTHFRKEVDAMEIKIAELKLRSGYLF